MITTRRVFIVEPCRLDVRNAAEFGTIEYLFDENDHRASIWTHDFLNEISNVLKKKKYDPSRDFFAVSGRLVPVTMAAIHILSLYKRVRFLFFNAVDRNYVERELSNETRNDQDILESPGSVYNPVPTT